ncbi:MAG: apolipoprotein N-acyltransferase [Sphingobacteriaceae bacterium]|nr:apolipoprotein N-acyltransferase [Sphingobacteriaceae bacterium]
MLQKTRFLILSILSGLLFSAGWFAPTTILIFFAWVPIFFIEDFISNSETIKKKKLKLTGTVYLSFFIWNICVTWWIYYASFGGAAMAIICNPIFMCVAFMVWYNLKQRINKPWAIWLFIPIWLGYEYGHTLWDLTWSWLIIGNAFAFNHNWIQWYEFTGTSGGSLWVLIVNILIYKLIKNKSYSIPSILKPVGALLIPIALSYIILSVSTSQQNSSGTNKTVVVQPNIDPYNDKFNSAPADQLRNLMLQINGKLDSTVDFLVLPETFLTESFIEGRENESYSLHFLMDSIIKKYPNITIVTGATTYNIFSPNDTPSSTARKDGNSGDYYDVFNTGLQFNNEGISYYHKSKLVPGVERMPFPTLFKPLESLAIDLGGTMGSLGVQDERTVFFSHNKKIGIAPVICYESAYSDYVADYIENGANLIFIITNDGWWENTPGHRQHLAYSRLRAIETRREIARCANTGISCFVTPYGDIEQATTYWEPAVISKNMTPNDKKTLFVKFGDIISYSSAFLAILLFIWSQILRFKKTPHL